MEEGYLILVWIGVKVVVVWVSSSLKVFVWSKEYFFLIEILKSLEEYGGGNGK